MPAATWSADGISTVWGRQIAVNEVPSHASLKHAECPATFDFTFTEGGEAGDATLTLLFNFLQ